MLQAVADKVGDAEFSARVFDDEAIANETYGYDADSGSYMDLSPEEGKAFEERKGQHLVAMYTGGLDTTVTPYAIDWYPGTFTSDPNVGQWVGSEDWKPQ